MSITVIGWILVAIMALIYVLFLVLFALCFRDFIQDFKASFTARDDRRRKHRRHAADDRRGRTPSLERSETVMRTETGDDAHNLMPSDLREQIPALYDTEKVDDPTVWVKWFTPDSSWTWYVTEYDPIERLCFGLVAGRERELGYFRLDEVAALRGLRVERDLHFTPTPLSAVRKSL